MPNKRSYPLKQKTPPENSRVLPERKFRPVRQLGSLSLHYLASAGDSARSQTIYGCPVETFGPYSQTYTSRMRLRFYFNSISRVSQRKHEPYFFIFIERSGFYFFYFS